MATFGAIQTAVSRRLLDANGTAVNSSDVALAINDAIKYWKFRRFWFNEVYDSGTMTPQDGTIPLPTNFLVPAFDAGGFQIEYSDTRYELLKVTAQEYNNLWLGNGYGIPKVYARVGSSYEVYPLPDRDYTVKIAYLKDYSDLVNSTDTNDFTNYADRLITLWATGNLIGELRQDEKMESYFRTAANDEYSNLQVLTGKSNGSGFLTVNSSLI